MDAQPSERARRLHTKAIATIIVLASIATACGEVLVPTASAPSANVQHDPVAEAIAIRSILGLRTDHEFVSALALDAAAVERGLKSAYGFPLTEVELTELDRRASRQSELMPLVQQLGAGDPEWGGMYIDQRAGGVVVALFTGHLDDHQATFDRFVQPGAGFEIRRARWTLVELGRFADRLEAEAVWFTSVDAIFQWSSVEVAQNVVTLSVRSRNSEVAYLIAEHFAADEGMLAIAVNPSLPWTGPRGSVVVAVRTDDGKKPHGVKCRLVPDDPDAWNAETRLGMGDRRIGVPASSMASGPVRSRSSSSVQ